MVELTTLYARFLKRTIAFALFVVLGEGCSPSCEAVAAMETFEQMLQQSETDARSRSVWPGEKAFDDAEREYGRTYDALFAISCKRERLAVATRMEHRLLEYIHARQSGFEEVRALFFSCSMFDGVVRAVWETTGDERCVFALWERRRRKCVAAAERCEKEEEYLKKEDKRLLENAMKMAVRMAKVGMKDLTADEKTQIDEAHAKRPSIEERLRGLYFLKKSYRTCTPGKTGVALANGKLYGRFLSLSRKELDRLAYAAWE